MSSAAPSLIAMNSDSLREAFGKALSGLADEFPSMVVLDADLAGGTGVHHFRKSHPERLLQFAIQAPVSVEEFWSLRCEMSEKLRGKLAGLPAEQAAEVKRQSLEAFREYSTDHGMSFPAEVLIVSGTKRPA